MKFGWPISVFLHLGLIGVGLITLSGPLDISDESRVIPIDIVTVSETTNIRATVRSETPEPTQDETPMQVQTPMENAPEEGEEQSRVTQTAPSVAALTPTPGGDQPADVSEEKPESDSFNLDDISALVDRTRATQPDANQQIAPQSEQNFYEFADNARRSVGEGTALTASEVDALKSAMYKCWRIPLDATSPEELIVRVRVKLRGDGAVERVDLVDQAAVFNSRNPFMAVAAQRAVAAVSKCAPYDFLPRDKYDTWKDMVLRFKPEI